MKKFGKKLKEIQENYRFTELGLALCFKTSKIHIENIKRLRRQPPNVEKILQGITFTTEDEKYDLAARALIEREFPEHLKLLYVEQLVKLVSAFLFVYDYCIKYAQCVDAVKYMEWLVYSVKTSLSKFTKA